MRFVSMKTKNGNNAKNQYKVIDDEGIHFFSYGSKIASFRRDAPFTLYNPYWDMYSQTTNYYLLQFSGEDSIKEIRKKVISGDFIVA
tara:strand:- start:892 stop:1152 length:261 start_codon:yes stop_codon:yes gene_type:complete